MTRFRNSKRRASNYDNQSDSGCSERSANRNRKRSKKANETESDDDRSSDHSISESSSVLEYFECQLCKNFKKKCDDIPNATLENAPTKKSRQFQIQINLRNYNSEIDRDIIFEKITSDILGVQCIVSLEENESFKTKYRSSKQFRILLNTKFTNKTWSSIEIYKYTYHLLREILGEEQEISKEDFGKINKTLDFDKRPEIIISKPNSLKEGVLWATVDFHPRFTDCFDHNYFS